MMARGALTIKVWLSVPFREAVMSAVVDAVTAVVAIGNVAVVWPERTVTLDGTLTSTLSLDTATMILLAGAALRVTVPVACPLGAAAPPTTADPGLSASDVTIKVPDGFTVKSAVSLPLFRVAVIVDVWSELPSGTVPVNIAPACPENTVTVAGTVAAEVLLLDKVTVVLAVTVVFKFTVPVKLPVAVVLASTVAGVNASEG